MRMDVFYSYVLTLNLRRWVQRIRIHNFPQKSNDATHIFTCEDNTHILPLGANAL